MIGRFVISCAFCLMAGAAMAEDPACEVATRAISSTVPGENCGITRLYAPEGEEIMAAAEDVGQGYVVQVLHETAACLHGETHLVVDCVDGTAYSFAPEGAALMSAADLAAAKDTSAYEQLVRYVRKSPRGYAPVAAWRRAKELNLVDLGSVLGHRVALGTRGETYDLTCGCKLHNPASIGAR